MKAGIYRTPNGNLIYVAKDRTVKATDLHPSSWPGSKVSHRASDDTVLLAGTYRCTRFADVPNGCTGFMDAIEQAKREDRETAEALALPCDMQPGETLAGYFRRKPQPNVHVIEARDPNSPPIYANELGSNLTRDRYPVSIIPGAVGVGAARILREIFDDGPDYTAIYKRSGFRPCHNRSARKHKKAGHTVFKGPGKLYYWRPRLDWPALPAFPPIAK